MSDFGEVVDAILLGVESKLTDGVRLHRGYKAPDDVTTTLAGGTEPVFAMCFNPVEASEEIEDRQFDRQVDYQLVLVRSNQPFDADGTPAGGIEGTPAFDLMAADLDAVRDWLQQDWPATPGPLGGLVDTVTVTERGLDEVSSMGQVVGLLTVRTTELT